MRIVVAYKWTRDPVAMELARQLAETAGAELIGVTAGGKGVAVRCPEMTGPDDANS
jgi:electron transfer flavoprotein alpha/beta subunit